MKLRILSEFDTPLNLQGADAIKVCFPYENGETLEKTKIDVLNVERGEIKVDLADFEIQGLKVGEKQTFRAEVVMGDEVYHVVFPKALNVEFRDERKVLA